VAWLELNFLGIIIKTLCKNFMAYFICIRLAKFSISHRTIEVSRKSASEQEETLALDKGSKVIVKKLDSLLSFESNKSMKS
jgi:hypothetical protein